MLAVDIFSGCGGASLGLERAGFRVVAAVDNDPSACATFKRNLGVDPICSDARRIGGDDILTAAGARRGEIDIVVGCPPCQGFSSLRRTRPKYARDPRNGLVRTLLRLVGEIRPKAVLFENVSGMIHRKTRQYLALYMGKLARLGYRSTWGCLEAADYGVPQFRKRLIVLSVDRTVKSVWLPPPTHANPTCAGKLALPKWRTVRDAIGDLPPLHAGEVHPTIPNHVATNHSARVLETVRRVPRDGGSRRSLPRYLWLRCHRRLDKGAENVYGRMSWNSPSPTITSRFNAPSCGRFIHPEQDRAITPREAARLQTFPDSFVFEGTAQSVARQIGNAMPVALAQALAKSIMKLLKGKV